MNYYLLGVVFGIIVGLGVFFTRWCIRKKSGAYPCNYDERQMVGRGKAFQAGFFTLLIAGGICNIWDFVSPLPGEGFVWNIGVMLLGVAVFAVTAIHFDAYLSLNENPRRFLTGGFCFIVSMTLFGVTNLHSARPENHLFGILNFGVGLVWLVIVIALLLHRRKAQKEEE